MRALLLLSLAGCGLGWIGGETDRTAGLPTSGAGPYERLSRDDATPASEPRFHDEIRASVEDPSMLAGGPGVRVWFANVTDEPVASEIRYIEATSLRALPTPPVTVLTATEAWEEGVVSAPSVSVDPAGGLVMYYEGGVTMPSIGRAVSDDGLAWVKDGLPVLAGAESPSVVFVDGETWLFATRPGEIGIWRAVSAGGGDFVFDPAPVVVPRPEEMDAFDRLAVFDPFALAVPTHPPVVRRDDRRAERGDVDRLRGVVRRRIVGAVRRAESDVDRGCDGPDRRARGVARLHAVRRAGRRRTLRDERCRALRLAVESARWRRRRTIAAARCAKPDAASR
jgi:hypothetical protein